MSAPSAPVRTRFAPSPTGYMHIGGMRTALFNWLWARHMGGKFILRIDDTDQQRNVDAALQPIFRAFRWLGLTWDEGPEVEGAPYAPYYQSQRTHLYQAAADKLLAEGKAFRDFDPPELTQADRQAAEQSKQPFLNIRRSLDLSPSEVEAKLGAGEPYVVRFLVPRDQKVAIDDAVRGHVEWDGALIADPVIQRSNGSVLYNFATVVDDAQMRISHVIRAEEHLTNTAVQALLHQALGNALPVFAHIPFITAPGSTKKLSKRDVDKLKNNPALKKMFERGDDVLPRLGFGGESLLNPVMVEYYERMGYLPAGILNTLARLGWSLDDKTEIFSLGDVVRDFTLERIVKNPAGLDADKLQSYQAHWMGQLSVEEKVAGVVPFLRRAGWIDEAGHIVPLTTSAPTPSGQETITGELPAATREFLTRLVTAMGDRLRIFSDVLETSEFFYADEALPYDEKAFQQRIAGSAEAGDILRAAMQALETAPQFEPAPLEALLHDLCESRGLKLGQLVAPLRVATTGKSNGVGLGDTLSLLGRERTLRRIARALDRAAVTTTP